MKTENRTFLNSAVFLQVKYLNEMFFLLKISALSACKIFKNFNHFPPTFLNPVMVIAVSFQQKEQHSQYNTHSGKSPDGTDEKKYL